MARRRRRFTRRARAAALRNLRKAWRKLRRRHVRRARRTVRRVRHAVRRRRAVIRHRGGRRFTRKARRAALRNLRKARRALRSGRTRRSYSRIDSGFASAMAPGGDFFGMGVNPKRVNRKTKRGKSVAHRRRIATALKRRRHLKGRVVVFPGGRVAVFHKPGTAAFRAGQAKKRRMGKWLARHFGFKKHRRSRSRRRNPAGFMWR